VSDRRHLPTRRLCNVVQFEHGGIRYYGSVGHLAEDRTDSIIEIFLDAGKPGSALQHMARDTAVVASLALQYGCPISAVRKAVTRLDDGSAAGPLGALIDLVEKK
jgi:hypothetical protein